MMKWAVALMVVSMCVATEVQVLDGDASIPCSIKADGCVQGYFRTEKCTCQECSACGDSQFKVKDCGGTSDTACENCRACDGKNNFKHKKCGASADAECASCTECQDGQTEAAPCSEEADRKCKACSTCKAEEFKAKECSSTEDTKCQQCSQCTESEYAVRTCGQDGQDRKCATCLVCEGKGGNGFQTKECTKTQNRECKACSTCNADTQYEKHACTATTDTDCASNVYVVKGKNTNPSTNDLAKGKKTHLDSAHVRCVDDTKGISICNQGCAKPAGPQDTCSKSFSPKKAGKKCYGACKPEDGDDKVTFEQASRMCEELGMRLPGNPTELARAKDTGCNFNGKMIWYNKQ